jgi:hypothetical protein
MCIVKKVKSFSCHCESVIKKLIIILNSFLASVDFVESTATGTILTFSKLDGVSSNKARHYSQLMTHEEPLVAKQ